MRKEEGGILFGFAMADGWAEDGGAGERAGIRLVGDEYKKTGNPLMSQQKPTDLLYGGSHNGLEQKPSQVLLAS